VSNAAGTTFSQRGVGPANSPPARVEMSGLVDNEPFINDETPLGSRSPKNCDREENGIEEEVSGNGSV
jgi:hypothetical protein